MPTTCAPDLDQTALHAVMPDPKDGSIWGSLWGIPGGVVRIDPGSNPPMTTLAEIYRPRMPGGHLGAFDRSKC
jgi:hypothetical protein